MKKKSTYGLRLDQMENLFSLGAPEPDAADEDNENKRMASLLQEQLTRPLPEGSLLLDALFMMLDQQGCNTGPLAGKSLGEVFLKPDTDPHLLEAIKNCCKKLSSALDSTAEKALATTLYFAALASALVHHNRKFSRTTYRELNDSFTLLTEKQWMAQDLISLFSRARCICANRKSRE